MAAKDIPQAWMVMTAAEYGIRLLEIGATEKALENFRTAGHDEWRPRQRTAVR